MVVQYEDSLDSRDKKFLEIIEKYDCHVMNVFPTEEDHGPEFTYSTGIYEKLQQPELLIFGLKSNLSHSMVNIYRDQVQNGVTFEHGQYYEGFIEGFSILMINANEAAHKDYATWSQWYYQSQNYPMYQVIWPSTQGIWPWEKDASDFLKDNQPILGSIPDTIL